MVAERFDDVVGGDADMRRARLDDLQHRPQHADDGRGRGILSLRTAAGAVEVAEQLVGSVDEMDDHGTKMQRGGAPVDGVRYTRTMADTRGFAHLFARGGEMGGLMRATDWAKTKLRPLPTPPQN